MTLSMLKNAPRNLVFFALVPASALLSGCSLLFDEDTREGTETAEECAVRVAGLLGPGTSYHAFTNNVGTPTFTYDVTKMPFEDLQALIDEGGDETAGRRLLDATNENSTARQTFMSMSVDEKGAFFLALDPSLYRVRGETQPLTEMIATGCERQTEGMRLIMIDVVPERVEPVLCPADPAEGEDIDPECLKQDEP